jgi:hypothetical protein
MVNELNKMSYFINHALNVHNQNFKHHQLQFFGISCTYLNTILMVNEYHNVYLNT